MYGMYMVRKYRTVIEHRCNVVLLRDKIVIWKLNVGSLSLKWKFCISILGWFVVWSEKFRLDIRKYLCHTIFFFFEEIELIS